MAAYDLRVMRSHKIRGSGDENGARASCSVGLKKLFAFTEFSFVVSVVQGHNKLATRMGSAAI